MCPIEVHSQDPCRLSMRAVKFVSNHTVRMICEDKIIPDTYSWGLPSSLHLVSFASEDGTRA